jgi:hypothetical protein
LVNGIFGAVVRKGAPEAGAVYVVVSHPDGTCHLFGPAPGPAYDDEGERRWSEELKPPSTSADVDTFLERRRRFDPDVWVVEVEDRSGTAGLVPAG